MQSALRVAEKQEQRTLNSISEELYSKYGNVEAALDEMVKEVVAIPELAMDAIRFACRHSLATMQGNVRHVAYHGITSCQRHSEAQNLNGNGELTKNLARRVRALGQANLLNFPLSDGTLLRNAKKEQVLRSATSYLNRGKDEIIKGRWLTFIAAGLQEKERVGQRYKEEDLVRLNDKAINEVEG